MKTFTVMLNLFLVLGFSSMKSYAHDGEDHTLPAPAMTQTVAPRASVQSQAFEVVLVANGKTLILYLDDFASNAPIAGAKVEINSADSINGVATQIAPAVYALDMPPLKPAKYPLTLTIEAGDTVDLLSATLDLTAPLADKPSNHNLWQWMLWLSMGIILLLGVALLLRRRRGQYHLMGAR